MKLSLNWLTQYIDCSLTPDELAYKLTMAGLEVEHIEKVGEDTVFEIEVTPNRPDCLNIIGLTREVAAILDKDMRLPEIQEYDDEGELDVTIEDPTGCGRYIGTLIDGISVKGTPVETLKLLSSMGANGISNIVDITNFTMFEFGQPLHAFDFDKLEGGKIIVRRAKKGEKIVTLDDVERVLDSTILVIADAVKPVAIAGIMGGRDTSVTSSTKRILLEAAHFDLGVIRRGSRKLGLTSDSAYRFERGVAWKTTETGSNRATDLILKIAGGKVVSRRDVIAKTLETTRHDISVSVSDIQSLLGAPLDLSKCEKILKRLGCVVATSHNNLTVIPPHNRGDLKIKQDIIEEVARVIGYDNLPMSLPNVKAINISVDLDRERFFDRVQDNLVAQGLHQIMTYALVSRPALEKSKYEGVKPIVLQNPMSAEQELMRPTMLPNFLTVMACNIHRGQKDLTLFEVAKRYLPGGERWTLGILMTGKRNMDWRLMKKAGVDLYDVKGAIEALATTLRVKGLSFVAVDDVRFELGQCAEVILNGKAIGRMGKVSDDVVTAWDVKKTAVYFAEIDLEDIRDAVLPQDKFMLLDEFPAMVRDLSLAVKDTPYEAMKMLAQENGKGLLRKIEFVELYTGDKIEAGLKGYVLSFTYQAKDRTLTDDEVNALHEDIAGKLIGKFGVKRR
ncbi:MAG: phenylalanine--tRNA ligase subunit beta [Candidatus Omnitrophica bacterium]|nr:phenylalanine--tRNA ligase subunit beta [Candidatus Omnitrophota bacterium]